jgi:hypothetical protein
VRARLQPARRLLGRRMTRPPKSVLDRSFRYVRAADQGPDYLKKKFARMQRKAATKPAVVTPIKKRAGA